MELESGHPDQALGDAQRALELLPAASPSGESSCVIGRAYLAMGRAMQAQGKSAEASAAFRSAAEHLQNTLGADNPDSRIAMELTKANTH